MARALITGGAGFIGSHLADFLVDAGHDVTVLDDFSSGSRSNLEQARKTGRLQVLEGTVLSSEDVHNALKGCETVFHLAVRSVRHSLGRPFENHAVNATGTLNMLEAARRAGVNRFVYCSSSEVYGNSGDAVMDENATVCRPVTVYGGAKLAGEYYATAYRETYGLSTVIVRPFNAYGPRAHLQGESGEVIPRFTARLLSDLPPIIFGTGNQTRDFTFVTEIARGIAAAGEVANVQGKIINIAFGQAVSLVELAKLTAEACARPDLKPQFSAPRPGDVQALLADVTQCRALLGFKPEIPLAEGLKRYLAWMKTAGSEAYDSLSRVKTINWTTL
ncbi:MAG: NAD-dependent epimerase/dehydratase family protein [Rhodospirillaceae bacterium]|nr:NAD-dependent epimerase/dehydratase family protein [Rhodospirillaceae bacterium]